MLVTAKIKSSEMFQIILDRLNTPDYWNKNRLFWTNLNGFYLQSGDLWRANCDSYLYTITKRLFPSEVKDYGKQTYLPSWSTWLESLCSKNLEVTLRVFKLAKIMALENKD